MPDGSYAPGATAPPDPNAPKPPTFPSWFLMFIAGAITVTWVIFALTIDAPGRSQNFLAVTGVFGVVVTALFGASYFRRKDESK